jgi:ribosomal protein S18 acetylase RimI-like enzyme
LACSKKAIRLPTDQELLNYMNIRIRKADLSDLAGLADLLYLLFSQEKDFSANSALQKKGVQMILENPQAGQIHVITKLQRVIGMVSILFTVSTALGGRVGILEDMIIHPDFRGIKAGEQLLQESLREAKAAGCLRITLLTDHDNDIAQKFYRKSGFEESSMKVFRKIFD